MEFYIVSPIGFELSNLYNNGKPLPIALTLEGVTSLGLPFKVSKLLYLHAASSF